ncbi:MAG TPA: NADP-dependent oxidoreductase [Candidatus Saccharimonadales bacterium]|nr:NADP-dependent oxidoreductase [Candidatus Saccharimonadales bacterium]
MRAAQINQYGGPEVLKTVNDAPKPTASPGQVLVEVYAASVNPFDATVRDGRAQSMAQLNFPATLGGDLAGKVAELGEGASGFQVGDEVYGQANALSGQGSFAEFTPVKAISLAPKPKSLDFTAAAALPLTGVSAYQALVNHLNLQSGQKILIHGGAGGIGSFAIQLAKHLGAHVAATAASEDLDFVKGLGADEVIDYKTQDFSKLLKDYDAVYDTIGAETYAKSFQILKPGGKIVSMKEQPNEELMRKHQVEAISQFTKVTTERLNKVAELVDNGVLKVNIDKVFPLEETGGALEYLKTGHTRGKIVIKIKD